PEQIVTSLPPAEYALSKAADSFSDGKTSAPFQPGMMIVPASASMSTPASGTTAKPPTARSGPGSAAHATKRYQSSPISGRDKPNTSTAHPNSKLQSPS